MQLQRYNIFNNRARILIPLCTPNREIWLKNAFKFIPNILYHKALGVNPVLWVICGEILFDMNASVLNVRYLDRRIS